MKRSYRQHLFSLRMRKVGKSRVAGRDRFHRCCSPTMTTFRRSLKALAKFSDVPARKWDAARVCKHLVLQPRRCRTPPTETGALVATKKHSVINPVGSAVAEALAQNTNYQLRVGGLDYFPSPRHMLGHKNTSKTTWARPCVHCRIRVQLAANQGGSRTPLAVAQ